MAKTDLIKARTRLTFEELIDDTAVRVRTRIDLYVNLPRTLAAPVKRQASDRLGVDLNFKGLEAAANSPDAGFSKGLGVDLSFEALEASVNKADNTAQKDIIGERALIPGLLALEMGWTRNPPAVADEFEIVLRGDAVPVDLRVFESIQVFGWLFVHEDHGQDLLSRMEQLKPGDPGSFGGIVDKVSRDDANGTFTLSCRDFTALPLSRDATPTVLDGLDLDQLVEDIVEDLIRSMPGGDQWEVTTRGEIGNDDTVSKVFSEEVKFKVKQRKRRKKRKEEKKANTPTNADLASDKAVTKKLFDGLSASDLAKISNDSTSSARGVNLLDPKSDEYKILQVLNEAGAGLAKPRSTRPARYITKIVQPTPDRIFGTKRMTIWQAITRVTQLMGVVAEVGISQTGRPSIAIVDQLEIQQGTVFRAFERDGRKHRLVTHGADLAQLVEDRDLVGAKRVNWVEVYSTDPVTGLTARERYSDGEFTESRTSRGVERKLADAGLTIFAPGCNSSEQLKRIAKRTWAQVNRGELEVRFSILVPWTTGGGIFDADLLTCAPGALIEMQFARADRFKGLELEDVLKLLGVPREAARKLAEASEQLKPSLLFQVAEIQHTIGEDGEYTASIVAQALLAEIHVPQGETLEGV